MAKDTIGVRLDPDVCAALKTAAAKAEWTVSHTASNAIVDWLRREGWLPKADGKAKRKVKVT
jgi:predicted transcriptional regulator